VSTTTVYTSRAGDLITGAFVNGTTAAAPSKVGWGTGTGTAARSDVAPIIEAAEARVTGTITQQTTTVTNDTIQVVGMITSSSTQTITETIISSQSTKPQSTTLSAAITTTGATSCTVTSASGFPGSGTYYVQIDSEVIGITAGQGTTTWTITRGQNGSTAATHLINAVVTGGNIPGSTAITNGDLFIHSTSSPGLGLNSGDSLTSTTKLTFA
jgi:hypothetical protein